MGKTLYTIVFGILIGLLAAGLILLVSAPSLNTPIMILPTSTPSNIVVHVTGQVIQPGVYRLPIGSRVEDALLAAGGLTGEADENQLNLAARLSDGQKLYVPIKGEVLPFNSVDPLWIPTYENENSPSIIDLNLATQQQLEDIPGIGPTKASEIIAYRQKIGRFVTIEEIKNVPGIGPSLFEKIKPYITVSNAP
ncbi:MAG: competence protein ComEA [Bellilinea sp.]|nr:MAG: competence protein ComEA [Bellilinea sp.]